MTIFRQTDRCRFFRPSTIFMLAFWAALCATRAFTQPPGRESPVGVATIVEREVSAGQAFLGTVYPHRKSTVGSTEEDRVIKFPVNEGDLVEAGQVLAELRSETLRIELAEAQAEAELRHQELEELKNGTRQEEKDAAAAELARDQALLEYAESRYQRAQQLHRENRAISQEELDEAKSAAVAAQNNHLASRAKYDLAEKGPRPEQILQAKARYEAQQQVVAKFNDLIDQRTIRAPFAGYVTAEHTEEGQWLAKGGPVVDLVDLESVEIHVAVPGQYISFVQTGTGAPVRVDALPGDAFAGEVLRIVPQADIRSRTFPVIVRVANRRQGDVYTLKAGMLARVSLAVGKPQRAMLVPKDALVLGGETPRVFVVRRDAKDRQRGKAAMVPVEIGVADGGLIQIIGAVTKGQLVVTRGNERLLPFGQPVQIVE
jgi:HlyD family secretion protein